MKNFSRRDFLVGGGLTAGGAAAGWFGADLLEYLGAGPETPWRAFTAAEAAEVDRLAEELVPADPPADWNGGRGCPGAHAAKVVRFIDWQLAPARPYAAALKSYRETLPRVKGLGAADVERKFPAFFKTLLEHVRQGFYAHPVHGGNADYASYRMVGLCGPAVTGRNVPGKPQTGILKKAALALALAFAATGAAAFDCSPAAKAKARDFIDNEKQFHLGFLPTEQSNPITATLEADFARSTLAGVQCLQRGDRQIPITMRHVFAGPRFEKLVASMVATLRAPKGRIVFSGCGATGRLSILLESMWRDFFHRRAAELTPAERALADRSASIMTGGDFALIRSVEFFEDFAEGGRRQAAALGVGAGDTFVAITEGGETSSVLGTLRYASEHGATCFLVFNNPADLLRNHLDRCREAIDDPKVTVIDLYCGAMSVAGSTRMQATSSEQLLGSCALEAALCRLLPRFAKETAPDYTVAFERLLAGLESPAARAGLVRAIDFEKGVYLQHGRITYLADACMLDLFTDNTERSPTFMLPPLRSRRDRALAQSWAFVKNPLHPTEACWHEMMRRAPRCLDFTAEDARSLKMPQRFIDHPPLIKYTDLVTYMIGNEPAPERTRGYARSAAVTLTVGDRPPVFVAAAARLAADWPERIDFHIGPVPTDGIWVDTPLAASPLEIWKHLAVKLAFNCLSTGTMAAMGRVAGNWMSWVSISNKKLIDRGIRLLMELGGIGYEEAAQRIFAAEEWVQAQDWTGREEPSAVQVALARLRGDARP